MLVGCLLLEVGSKRGTTRSALGWVLVNSATGDAKERMKDMHVKFAEDIPKCQCVWRQLEGRELEGSWKIGPHEMQHGQRPGHTLERQSLAGMQAGVGSSRGQIWEMVLDTGRQRGQLCQLCPGQHLRWGEQAMAPKPGKGSVHPT